jgi:hypothetical protein
MYVLSSELPYRQVKHFKSKRLDIITALRLLYFVLHVKIGQAVIAALHKKDEEDHREEAAFIILARCHKNSEKLRK